MALDSYIIVGSGVFGASTALHLIRRYPGAHITLVDRDHYDAPTRVAASWDWNKVIRADYADILYTRLALEAQNLWRTDPIWQAFYHESGVVWISSASFAGSALGNFAELGVEAGLNKFTVEETQGLHNGLLRDADYTGIKEVLVNNRSGWAEAKEALQSTIRAAVDLGVKYLVAEVKAVNFENNGSRRRCCGISTADDIVSADHIVLCSGAYTSRLLVESDPQWTDLHAGDRILAAGVTEATAALRPNESTALADMPVAISVNPVGRGT